MRQINIDKWPRQKHFKYFNLYDYPHFSICSQVDLLLYGEAFQDFFN